MAQRSYGLEWAASPVSGSFPSVECVRERNSASGQARLSRRSFLGGSAAVQTSDSFKIPPALRENAWFVSVDVRPEPGIETWVISDKDKIDKIREIIRKAAQDIEAITK